VNIQGEVDFLKQIQASGSADIQQVISGFLCKIDEVNGSLQILFGGVYKTFMANPCQLDKWLAKQVEDIIKQEMMMRESINKLRLKTMMGQDTKEAVSEATEEVVNGESKKRVEAFKEVPEEIREWEKKR
jgi:hypothetical protein